jgi:hypothetical protein
MTDETQNSDSQKRVVVNDLFDIPEFNIGSPVAISYQKYDADEIMQITGQLVDRDSANIYLSLRNEHANWDVKHMGGLRRLVLGVKTIKKEWIQEIRTFDSSKIYVYKR